MTMVVVVVVALALTDAFKGNTWEAEGIACACDPEFEIEFKSAFTNDDGKVNSDKRDPDDDGTDPGYDKDVARCDAKVISEQTIEVSVVNGYPGYTCHFWTKIRNTGEEELQRETPVITAPPNLKVEHVESTGPTVLDPDEKAYEGFSIHFEQNTEERASYQFTIDLKFTEDD